MISIKYGVFDTTRNKIVAFEDDKAIAEKMVNSLNSRKKIETLKLVKVETVTTITITEI